MQAIQFACQYSRTAVHRQEDLLRDILDTATHYVTRYPLGCDMLN